MDSIFSCVRMKVRAFQYLKSAMARETVNLISLMKSCAVRILLFFVKRCRPCCFIPAAFVVVIVVVDIYLLLR